MSAELGIIEGYYGKPWSWRAREESVAYLKPYGYGFHLYAPKADPYLRIRWREDYPVETADALKTFAASCATHDVRFGIGISPVMPSGFDRDAQRALARKLAFFDDIGVEDVAILFDDMTGATADLASRQVDIVHWAASRTKATRLLMCPSYYTDDPVLDRVFGARPACYVEDIGRLLDGTIGVFWTGEEVCSKEISVGHVTRVAEMLQRDPFLWDNYPVNDGARMSQYLHLRGFTGRSGRLRGHIQAHGVNPSLQPVLNRIPCVTLASCYRDGDAYEYGAATKDAARVVAGETLGMNLYEDVLVLQEIGLDRLGEREAVLRERYAAADDEAAREIIAWLDGEYRITDALIRAMAGNEQG